MADLYELSRYKDKVELITHPHFKMKHITVIRVFFSSIIGDSEKPVLFKNFLFPDRVAKKIIEKNRQRGVKVRELGIKFMLKKSEDLDPNQRKELLHVCCALLN